MKLTRPTLCSLLVASILAIACGRARPYRAMVRTAESEENVASQAEDHRL
jgi:hypothetical protein